MNAEHREGTTEGHGTLGAAHEAMIRAFAPIAGHADPLDVELFASSLLGTWWQALPPPADTDALLGHSTITYAAGHPEPAALALLRALASLGPSDELRQAAGAAANTLSDAGVAEPSWSGSIGQVRPGACWLLSDVYGNQASLCCEFTYAGGSRHALLASLEFTPPDRPGGAAGGVPAEGFVDGPGTARGGKIPTARAAGVAESPEREDGWVRDAWVSVEPDRIVAGMRDQARSALMELSSVEATQAGALLATGLAGTDAIWQPDVLDTFRDHRALALARCRVLTQTAA